MAHPCRLPDTYVVRGLFFMFRTCLDLYNAWCFGNSLTVDPQLSIYRKMCLTEALSSKRSSQLIWIGDSLAGKEGRHKRVWLASETAIE